MHRPGHRDRRARGQRHGPPRRRAVRQRDRVLAARLARRGRGPPGRRPVRCCSVEDRGIGISPDQLRDLNERLANAAHGGRRRLPDDGPGRGRPAGGPARRQGRAAPGRRSAAPSPTSTCPAACSCRGRWPAARTPRSASRRPSRWARRPPAPAPAATACTFPPPLALESGPSALDRRVARRVDCQPADRRRPASASRPRTTASPPSPAPAFGGPPSGRPGGHPPARAGRPAAAASAALRCRGRPPAVAAGLGPRPARHGRRPPATWAAGSRGDRRGLRPLGQRGQRRSWPAGLGRPDRRHAERCTAVAGGRRSDRTRCRSAGPATSGATAVRPADSPAAARLARTRGGRGPAAPGTPGGPPAAAGVDPAVAADRLRRPGWADPSSGARRRMPPGFAGRPRRASARRRAPAGPPPAAHPPLWPPVAEPAEPRCRGPGRALSPSLDMTADPAGCAATWPPAAAHRRTRPATVRRRDDGAADLP